MKGMLLHCRHSWQRSCWETATQAAPPCARLRSWCSCWTPRHRFAAQALTQCPPALPPAQPRSGHASMPLPVTQVRSPRHPPKREGTTGCEWGDAFDVDTTEAISGLPDSLCSELSCLLRAHPPIHATGK